MPSKNKYKLERIWRYYFPCSFFIIFLLDLSRNLFLTNLRLSGTSDLLFFLGELGLLYLMLHLFTVEYEMDDDKLIVHSFLFHRKVFNLKDIVQVKEHWALGSDQVNILKTINMFSENGLILGQ